MDGRGERADPPAYTKTYIRKPSNLSIHLPSAAPGAAATRSARSPPAASPGRRGLRASPPPPRRAPSRAGGPPPVGDHRWWWCGRVKSDRTLRGQDAGGREPLTPMTTIPIPPKTFKTHRGHAVVRGAADRPVAQQAHALPLRTLHVTAASLPAALAAPPVGLPSPRQPQQPLLERARDGRERRRAGGLLVCWGSQAGE